MKNILNKIIAIGETFQSKEGKETVFQINYNGKEVETIKTYLKLNKKVYVVAYHKLDPSHWERIKEREVTDKNEILMVMDYMLKYSNKN